jgi:outer membrane protein OmpA-like peptidoglycan-associated protein
MNRMPAMKTNKTSRIGVIAAAAMALTLGACSTLQADNPALMDAHAAYNAAASNPLTTEYAGAEMLQAKTALDRADRAYDDHDKPRHVEHLAYEARQHVAIANEVAQRKGAEQSVAEANAERDRIRLDARTREADRAQMNAEVAQSQAQAAQGQALIAQREAEAAKAQAEDAQAAAAQAQVRNSQLVILLQELNAKQTERGMVVTINDVLFDTNRAELKPGAMRSIEKLGALLRDDRSRRVEVNGFTDSTGSQDTNDVLSARRASAVRDALVSQGVTNDRVIARGLGEAYPVASNDTAAGRQMNRRVEIVLEGMNVAQR